MELLSRYENGNVRTSIFSDGTKIRETEDEEFRPDFAENIDIKICNRCDIGCKFCHEGSSADGKLGDILNEKFIDTLHPFQEVALGGGNLLEHPDFIPFLYKLKDRNVITNITLHQIHFEKNYKLIKQIVKDTLVYGVGVSLVSPTEEFIFRIRQFPNAVIHVINGLFSPSDLKSLKNKGLKMLILGYKNLRRGSEWLKDNAGDIRKNQKWVKENLKYIANQFTVLSFDNLAIEQLDVKSLLSQEEWDDFYAGDDGTNSYYIDMVERKFAKSSTASFDERYALIDSVDEMFHGILGESNHNK